MATLHSDDKTFTNDAPPPYEVATAPPIEPEHQPITHQPQYPNTIVYQSQSYGSHPVTQRVVHIRTDPIPKPYFVWSILNIIFCCPCLPFGIVGMIKSCEVRQRVALGDWEGASMSSRAAQRVNLVGTLIGLTIWIVVVIAEVSLTG